MRPRSFRTFLIAVFLAAVAGVSVSFWRRQETLRLRQELELAKMISAELARLRLENLRLKAQQVSSAELAALRADHEAVVKLRKEVEVLQRSTESRPQTLAPAESRFPQESNRVSFSPAASLAMRAGKDGKVSLEGAFVDSSLLRQQLASLPRGSGFEIRLQIPKTETPGESAALKAGIDQAVKIAAEMAKELGLVMRVKTESSSP